MAEIKIDRLSLRLSGLAAHDGERLATLVANGLALAGGALAEPLQVEELQVHGVVDPGGSLERLADRIVADVLRQLATMV